MPQRLFDRIQRTQSYSPNTSTSEFKHQHHDDQLNRPIAAPAVPRPFTAPHQHQFSSFNCSESAAMDGSHPKRSAPKEDEAGSLEKVTAVTALRPPLKMLRTVSSSSVSSLGSYMPPDNFALVTGMVYRSSFPKPENLPYLKKLGLKTILTLVGDEYPEANVEFLKENGITHHQIDMPGNKENCITPVPDEKITSALQIILNRRNHPILVHCNKGKHRTGTVIGCLRRFQAWSPALALEEYRKFAGSKSRPHDLKKIEAYRLEACLDMAWEHDWIPTTFPDEIEEEGSETPLSIMCPAAIKAQ